MIVPYVTESTPHGERTSDVFSRLLCNRIVFIGAEIDDGVAHRPRRGPVARRPRPRPRPARDGSRLLRGGRRGRLPHRGSRLTRVRIFALRHQGQLDPPRRRRGGGHRGQVGDSTAQQFRELETQCTGHGRENLRGRFLATTLDLGQIRQRDSGRDGDLGECGAGRFVRRAGKRRSPRAGGFRAVPTRRHG